MACMEKGCSQPTLGHDRCYFHRKQKRGLIPTKDREFYLQKQDRAIIHRNAKPQVDLFYQYLPMVRRMAASVINGMPLQLPLRDAMQEIYTAWWSACQSEVNVENYEPYIVSIIKNTAISIFRKERCGVEFIECEIENVCAPDSEDPVCELQEVLKKTGRCLTTMDRYLLRNYILGKKKITLEQMGERFGISKVGIFHRVVKIKKKIKEALQNA